MSSPELTGPGPSVAYQIVDGKVSIIGTEPSLEEEAKTFKWLRDEVQKFEYRSEPSRFAILMFSFHRDCQVERINKMLDDKLTPNTDELIWRIPSIKSMSYISQLIRPQSVIMFRFGDYICQKLGEPGALSYQEEKCARRFVNAANRLSSMSSQSERQLSIPEQLFLHDVVKRTRSLLSKKDDVSYRNVVRDLVVNCEDVLTRCDMVIHPPKGFFRRWLYSLSTDDIGHILQAVTLCRSGSSKEMTSRLLARELTIAQISIDHGIDISQRELQRVTGEETFQKTSDDWWIMLAGSAWVKFNTQVSYILPKKAELDGYTNGASWFSDTKEAYAEFGGEQIRVATRENAIRDRALVESLTAHPNPVVESIPPNLNKRSNPWDIERDAKRLQR